MYFIVCCEWLWYLRAYQPCVEQRDFALAHRCVLPVGVVMAQSLFWGVSYHTHGTAQQALCLLPCIENNRFGKQNEVLLIYVGVHLILYQSSEASGHPDHCINELAFAWGQWLRDTC